MPNKDNSTRKTKQKQYSKNWYLRNRKERIRKSREQKDKIRKIWTAYKAKQKCAHCGMQHHAVIDFHHVIKKNKKAVNKLIGRGKVRSAITEAEEKCIPLCSNCHRIHHWKEHKKRAKKKSKT